MARQNYSKGSDSPNHPKNKRPRAKKKAPKKKVSGREYFKKAASENAKKAMPKAKKKAPTKRAKPMPKKGETMNRLNAMTKFKDVFKKRRGQNKGR